MQREFPLESERERLNHWNLTITLIDTQAVSHKCKTAQRAPLDRCKSTRERGAFVEVFRRRPVVGIGLRVIVRILLPGTGAT